MGFWVVPSSIEWDCHSPCPQCFYFDTGAVNASRTQVTVGYGVGMDSFVHSSEAAIANSTGLQAELPDDQDNLAVVGIDMRNDGVLNLEIWADEAESDDDKDADIDDADVQTAWVGGVARRTTRRVIRRPVVPVVPVVPGVRGVARRTTRRVVRRTARRAFVR